MTIYDRDGNLIPNELREITTSIELITPERANMFLNKMAKNRTIHKHNMNKLKVDLMSNRFTFCPSPIIFNQKGEMIDGQHRCKAVCESKEPFWGIVLYNVPDDVVIDRGAPRSTGEELYMRNLLNKEMSKKQFISIARRYLTCKYGDTGRDASDSIIGEFISSYYGDLQTAYSLSYLGVSTSAPCKKTGVQAAIFAALRCGVRIDTLERFTRIANDGYAESQADFAAVTLNKFLSDFTSKKGGGSIDFLTAFTENAIRDFVNHNPRKRVYKDPKHVYIDICDAALPEGVE